MERAIILFPIATVGQAIAHGHVSPVLSKRADQIGSRICWIGVIAIDHEVVLCVDLAKHLTHNIAFSLARLVDDDRPMLTGDLCGPIGRIVVIDVDLCQRKRGGEIIDDLANSELLVIAGYEHSNIRALACLIDRALLLCCVHARINWTHAL